MSTITIQLSDDRMQALQKLAHEANVRPEDLLETRVVEWLKTPGQDLMKAAQYVLTKNQELYRRLATGQKANARTVGITKIPCPCGYAHDPARLDDGWLATPNRELNSLIPKESATDLNWRSIMAQVIRSSAVLFQCPDCGRVAWMMPGDKCNDITFYGPDLT